MKQVVICSLFLLSLNIGAAQTFQWQHPTPVGNNLNDAIILPSGTWVLTGDGSTVARSTNNGTTWTVAYPETLGSDIYESMFVNDNIGYFCTTNGTIMKTTDGGVTWQYQNSGTSAQLWYLDFFNADTGLAVGASSTILRTTNGGTTWLPFNLATSTLIYKVHYVNAMTAYIGTSSATVGRLLRSTDAGQTWNNVPGYTGGGTTRGIFFINPDTGWVTNSLYQIYRTTNGGTTFDLQGTFGTGSFYEIKFINSLEGVAIGASGDVYVTTNSGVNWTPTNIGYNSNVFGLGMSGILGRAGRATGTTTILVGGVGGAIASSATWGSTWDGHTNFVVRQELRGIQFLNATTGYAVGGSLVAADSLGVILKTTDGGTNWSLLPFNPRSRIYGQYWIDADTGYIATQGPTGMWKTTDGGSTFTQLNLGIGVATSIWYSVKFLDSQTGYVCGSAGFLAKTTNGGAVWTPQVSGHGNSAIYDIHIIDAQYAVTTGGSGRVYRTTDGGALWSSIGIGGTITVYSSWWYDRDTGYVSGSAGTIRRTTNGGLSWSPQTIGTTGILYRIHFTDLQNGWTSGSLGSIFRTTDGGATWVRATRILASGKTLFDFDIAANRIWASGTDATIISANLSGVSVGGNSGMVPESFALYQNYPNPFNPTTTIQYALPAEASVNLKIYNLLGQELATLVEELQGAGYHAAPWNGRNTYGVQVATGVYFYRIEAVGSDGSARFTSTKKMLFVR